MDNKDLFHIFEGTLSGELIDEILYLADIIAPASNHDLIRDIHQDIPGFFSGSHPHFKKNTLPYHNLRHTQMVVLATIRLFHGLHCNQVNISEDILNKGLLAAYFHDTGLLLLEGDPAQTGTKYLAGHEARSILFLQQYTSLKGYKEDVGKDCATIINYTDLSSNPENFDLHTHEIMIAGEVVGSADILAQMADRHYLECLPLLYKEQKAGGTNKHNSAMELIEHTANFYHNIVLKRLATTFSDTSKAMRTHFRERHMIDRDLYLENINKNITYLKEIIAECDNIECLEKQLKRIPPII